MSDEMNPDSPRFIPMAIGIVALMGWLFFFAARHMLNAWEAGGKTGHIHVGWRALYDLGGRPAVLGFHAGIALLFTGLAIFAAVRFWR